MSTYLLSSLNLRGLTCRTAPGCEKVVRIPFMRPVLRYNPTQKAGLSPGKGIYLFTRASTARGMSTLSITW